EAMRQWNKNVLRDENDDNDVAADATAAQTATRHISTRVHRAPHAQSFAHIRRPLRLSEHKCSIRVKFLARSPSRFRASPIPFSASPFPLPASRLPLPPSPFDL